MIGLNQIHFFWLEEWSKNCILEVKMIRVRLKKSIFKFKISSFTLYRKLDLILFEAFLQHDSE